MLAEENGTSLYKDENIEVKTGVDPKKDGIKIKYHRDLSNSIKIVASVENAHFIQFITRQSPDRFTYEETKGETLNWDAVDTNYMTDTINPKWDLDVTESSPSCFYEEEGLSLKKESFISMYDCPGGDYEPKEERSVFCTFVM
jgi:hypothetical protein